MHGLVEKEKGFSLGYFDREYISRAPIATLSDADGKIIAFTTFMPVYQNGSLSVDLMRYYPDAPKRHYGRNFHPLIPVGKRK